jgi:hypothetical protein
MSKTHSAIRATNKSLNADWNGFPLIGATLCGLAIYLRTGDFLVFNFGNSGNFGSYGNPKKRAAPFSAAALASSITSKQRSMWAKSWGELAHMLPHIRRIPCY